MTTVVQPRSYEELLSVITDRLRGVHLASLRHPTGHTLDDVEYVADVKKHCINLGPFSDDAKRLWAVREELQRSIDALQDSIDAHTNMSREGSWPVQAALQALRDRQGEVTHKLTIVDSLLRTELCRLYPDIPDDATLLTIEDFQLYMDVPDADFNTAGLMISLGFGVYGHARPSAYSRRKRNRPD